MIKLLLTFEHCARNSAGFSVDLWKNAFPDRISHSAIRWLRNVAPSAERAMYPAWEARANRRICPVEHVHAVSALMKYGLSG